MISYSSDSMLKKCPRQFHKVRVLKNTPCAWCPCRTCEHNAPARAAATAKGKKLPT